MHWRSPHDETKQAVLMLSITRLMRVVAWLGIIAIAAASLMPSQGLIRTGFNGLLEHAAAYLLTASAIMLGYPACSYSIFVLTLSAYAALLEVGQSFVPGRQARLIDWGASLVGVFCAWIFVLLWRARKPVARG